MPTPRYKQLVDQLAADIREGRLRPGMRLPTHRELAAREGLAPVSYTHLDVYKRQLYLCGFACIASMSIDRAPPRREPTTWRTLFAGITFIFQRRILLGTLSLDLFAVLLGGATALLPIFAKDIDVYKRQPFYDPMIAKLIVHGADRDQARARMLQALAQTLSLIHIFFHSFLVVLGSTASGNA